MLLYFTRSIIAIVASNPCQHFLVALYRHLERRPFAVWRLRREIARLSFFLLHFFAMHFLLVLYYFFYVKILNIS